MAGLLTATLAHDVHNLLMVAEANLEDLCGTHAELRDSEEIEEHANALRGVREYAERLSRLGKESSSGERKQVELSALVTDALALVRKHPVLVGCHVRRELGGPLLMDANAPALDRAVMNLVLNAAHATGGAGTILVRMRRREGCARVEVHDDGPGIPEGQRRSVLEPFATSKQGHSGLGLVSVRACVEAHGGRVEIGESPLGGACVAFELPLS